jgi:hypothetical protein
MARRSCTEIPVLNLMFHCAVLCPNYTQDSHSTTNSAFEIAAQTSKAQNLFPTGLLDFMAIFFLD